jgi:ribonuclease HI
VGIVLLSPKGPIFETSAHCEYICTNNQAEFEATLLGLQIISFMGVKHVEAFDDFFTGRAASVKYFPMF